ncbi:MAG TPA: hypothetical protein VJJ47_02095 [Candidatus Paceibacterota bacterium]
MLYPLLPYLLRTLLVEGLIVGATWGRRFNFWILIAALFAVNFMTHPVGAELIFREGWSIWLVELLIPIAEGVGYRYALGVKWKEAIGISFLANMVSFFVGMVLG